MNETWFVFDVESSGPYPPAYSMLSIGIVKLTPELNVTFYSEMAALPGSDYDERAMEVNGLNWEDHIKAIKVANIETCMLDLASYVESNTDPNTRAVAVSDNPAFDWQWLNYYMHEFTGENPFGWSARRIGDMWHGLTSQIHMSDRTNGQFSGIISWISKLPNHWHELRQTPYTHNALDDAKANASALLEMHKRYGLEIPCQLS